MSATDGPSEEEMRAAYEAEIKKIGVDQILLEQVVTLINLAMRRTGMQPGTEDERDPAQVRMAIEAVRALLPLVEEAAGPQAAPIREALSQIQMAYVRMSGADEVPAGAPAPGVSAAEAPGPGQASPGAAPPPPPRPDAGRAPSPPPGPGGPAGPAAPGEDPGGPAQRSGRLWVPGQR